MKYLWIAFIVVATLGSIYPFDFQASLAGPDAIHAFLLTCCGTPGRGDMLGNLLLFLPFGFTGLLALRSAGAPVSAFLFVCFVGVLFALALQILQLFLPSRDENLQDVVWNLAGTAGGALLALGMRRFAVLPGAGIGSAALAPASLVATWLIYRLIPFVPSLDLQLIKDSVRPLVFGEFTAVGALSDFAAWLLVAWLLRRMRPEDRLDRLLPAVVVAVLFLEVLIVSNSVGRANVVGAGLAVLLWPLAGRLRRPEVAILGILGAALVLGGLAPFVPRAVAVDFNWLPFHGFLGGSMYVNAQSAAEKVFLYGGLVYLLGHLSVPKALSLGAAFVFVALIEFAQTRLAGHTPESTDPLLLLLAALALLSLQRQERSTAVAVARERGPQRRKSPPSVPGNGNHAWVPLRVNLRREQYDLLRQLALEMGVSVSGVMRLILQRFIEETTAPATAPNEQGIPVAAQVLRSAGGGLNSADRTGHFHLADDRWVNRTVNLRGGQHEFLEGVSTAMHISLSATTRQIVARFIDRLEQDEQPEAPPPN